MAKTTIEEINPPSADSQVFPEENDQEGGDSHVDHQRELSPNSSLKETEMQDSEATLDLDLDEIYTSSMDGAISAEPLSYKFPGDDVIMISTPWKKQHLETIPKEDKGDTRKPDKVIETIPFSFNRPGDQAIIVSSTTKKNGKAEAQECHQNWVCQPRQRSNGKFDKYYYHKELNLMCRSLKEIDRFELYGIRPGHQGKEKERETVAGKTKLYSEANETVEASSKRNKISSSSEAYAQIEAGKMPISDEKETAAEEVKKSSEGTETVEDSSRGFIEISTSSGSRFKSKAQITVENFLAESRYNLMHFFDHKNDSSQDSMETHPPDAGSV